MFSSTTSLSSCLPLDLRAYTTLAVATTNMAAAIDSDTAITAVVLLVDSWGDT